MDLSLFSIEQIIKPSNNGQCRLFIGQTCVIATIQGVSSSNSVRASEQGIVEVQVKMEFKGDQKKQRYIEGLLVSALESSIATDNYPQKQIKVLLQVLCNTGNLFSTLFNAALIGLLHNGIALRTTPFAYEFAVLPSGGVKLYPTKKEFGFEDDFETVGVVVDLNTQGIISLQNSHAYDNKVILEGLKLVVSQTEVTKNLLKSYLTQQILKHNN